MNSVRNMKVAGLALALCAGAAAAQSSDFRKPLARTQDPVSQPSSGGRSFTVIKSSEDDGDSYEITINNGEIAAKVNGKAVPSDRVRRGDGKVEILDKKGNVLKTFEVTALPGGSWGVGSGQGGNWTARRAPHALVPDQPQPPQPPQIMIDGVKPKVMVGITMNQPSEALSEHLNIKPDEAVVVERVIDGLPADKAGLKVQDIIVDVDGVHPVTQENFRVTINKKEPGDKVVLKILRKGEEKKLTVELQKFDAEKLGMTQQMEQFGELPMIDMYRQGGQGNQQWQDAMKEALKSGKGNAFVWGQGGPDENMRFTPFGGNNVEAKRMDEMQGQIDKKIAELDKRLAEINDQMARLEKLLSKMNEKQGR